MISTAEVGGFNSGGVVLPRNTRLGILREFESDKPLIELVGKGDVSRSIYILNMAGLSEAYLYLKRFSELSAGQQYRAMTAKLIDAECNLWVADEFCSALDPLTSYVVAQNIRRQAELCAATVVVAAPHCSYFADGLQPDRVLYLTSGRSHTLF